VAKRTQSNKSTPEKAKAGPEAVAIPPALAQVTAAFARDRAVAAAKGWGAGNVVLKVKGKIFVMLHKGSFVAKLPRERVAALVADGTGHFFDPGRGRLMKEWVVIEGQGARWVDLATEACAFVKRLG
jgi:hypothetical protein